MRRAFLRVFVVVSVIAAATLTLETSASAAYISCADTSRQARDDRTRCYSEQIGSFPSVYTGAWMQTHANNLGPGSPTSDSQPWMANNTLWWSNGGSYNYTEAGITNRWNATNHLNTYGPYLEENYFDGQFHALVAYPYYMSPNGSAITFQISRGPRVNAWNYYLTGWNGPAYTSTHQDYWTGSEIESGGELWTPNHGAFANTFDNYLRVIDGNGNGVSVPGMNASQPGFIWRINNNGSTTPATCCFNGSAWYNSEWSWNASIS